MSIFPILTIETLRKSYKIIQFHKKHAVTLEFEISKIALH